MSWAGFEKIAPLTAGLSISAMVISRAPTLVSEFSALGIKFNINVGYVVLFSIPIFMFMLIWLWINRNLSVLEKRPYSNNKWLISFLVAFPTFSSIFMFVQFMTELSPKSECNTFSSFRYFWDIGLWGIKPEYCFSRLDEIQNFMPYIYPPLQTWLYLIFVGINIILSIKLWRFYRFQK